MRNPFVNPLLLQSCLEALPFSLLQGTSVPCVSAPWESDPGEQVDREAWGAPLPDLNWYRALAAYKFAVITGFNLSLHRRGKRHDPSWEVTRLSMPTLMSRALELLG